LKQDLAAKPLITAHAVQMLGIKGAFQLHGVISQVENGLCHTGNKNANGSTLVFVKAELIPGRQLHSQKVTRK
jgi:hypothetical protein